MFISIKNAKKQYGEGNTAVYALRDANVEIENGEICVILGPSGSGKSTLLNVIGGLDKLDSGSVMIDGEDISNMSADKLTDFRRKSVGFVFQFYNLIMDLTVGENIATVSDISEHPLDASAILKALDIEQYKDRFPKELSGGQQQRVSIARALIKNPKILLCDEPTGALDSKSSKEVLRFIQKVNREYKTLVIIVTHNENVAKMADRIIRVKDGKAVDNYLNPNKADVADIEL